MYLIGILCKVYMYCILYIACLDHYNDVIMSAMVSQITSLTIIYSNVYSGADQRKHQISVSLAFVRGIHRWPVNSPHKGPVTRKMIPFDDVVMCCYKTCKHLRNFHRKIKQEYWLNVLQVRFNAWTTNAVLWCISCLFVKEKALKRYKDMLWIYM